MVHLNNKSVN